MDPKLIYVKTPGGDEAVRQSTRVVQRNLRMVLVQVDGKLNVAELSAKIGDVQLVQNALRELEEGGFITPGAKGISAWEEASQTATLAPLSGLSEFSTFGAKSVTPSINPFDAAKNNSQIRNFSSFGKPILPSSRHRAGEKAQATNSGEPADRLAVSRDQLSLFKWLIGGLLGLAGILLGLVIFYPYARFIPAIEASAAVFLQTPVRIGHLGVTLSPWPQLTLGQVTLGEPVDSRIDSIRIAAPLTLLMGGPHRLATVNVSGAAISANRLVALPFFSQPASRLTGNNISLGELRITESQVTIEMLALRDISGIVRFKSDGVVENASFQAVDRSIQLDVSPTAEGMALRINAQAWKPAGSLLAFDSLQAQGLLQADRLLIQNLDTAVLGGHLKGALILDWRNGLVIAGDVTLRHLDCHKVSAAFAPALELAGELAGTLHLRAAGNDWESLWQGVEATLDADITRGMLHGVDLGEAALRGPGAVARSGSTKFDQLRTKLTISPNQVSGRAIQMTAGMMTASGQFVVDRESQVKADLMVDIGGSKSMQRMPVRVTGALPKLVATGSK